jgi:hypothetical protein
LTSAPASPNHFEPLFAGTVRRASGPAPPWQSGIHDPAEDSAGPASTHPAAAEVTMKKLILENIRVESFVTGGSISARGTIQAHQVALPEIPDNPEPISKSCASDITWINGPVCCALY